MKLLQVLLVICAGLCASVASAQSYLVTVDTSELAGTDGYVNFQFNPADLGAPAAEASVLQWLGSTTLLDAPLIEGNVTGALPGTMTLSNGTAFNDYFHAAQFGDAFSFVVQFSGGVSPSALGTSFALALYADDAATPLLTNDISGSLVCFELSSAGIDFLTSSSAVQVTPVPLPAAAWLLLSGIVTLGGAARSCRRALAA
jgi:hypothetical protein